MAIQPEPTSTPSQATTVEASRRSIIARLFLSGCHPANSRSMAINLGLLFFVVALLSCLQAASHRGVLQASPVNGGDEDDYERLGYNLASGLGFGYCPSDTLIFQGLAEPQAGDHCEAGCSEQDFEVTAFRPPGFPFLIAAVYQISPLNFPAIRVINCFCSAIAIGVVSAVFARRLSLWSGVAAGVICSIDPRFREFAGTFLTENLATLMLCLFAMSLVYFLDRKTTSLGLFCGLSLSTLVFVRSFYVVWYPLLWLLILYVLYRATMRQQLDRAKALRSLVVFCVSSLIVTAPWWVRNCLVLEAVMPTGTQGGIGICDGFSDSAYEHFGSWTPRTAALIADEMRKEPEFANAKRLPCEKEWCRRGSAHASQWIRKHPERLFQLSCWKLAGLWELRSVRHMILFGMCFVGLWAARRDTTGPVIFLLLLLNSLTVVATYHTYERFMTPFRPIIHGLAGFGMQTLLLIVLSRFRSPLIEAPEARST